MKLKSNGIEINYEIEGSGPWLTMSHSLACNLHMWDPQMPVLTGRFKVLRFDTRGHGQSDAPAGEYTLEQLADDVMERIGSDIRATPVEGFAGCCHAIAKVDYLDRLKEITIPALVMVGEHDHGTPPEAARIIQQNLPGSELKILASAAHLSNIEQADEFNKAMVGFLHRVAKRQ